MGKEVVVDSDILVGLYKPHDSNHKKALDLVKKLKDSGFVFSILNIVLQESVTVISHHMGMEDARKFYAGIFTFVDKIINVDGNLEKRAWEVFLEQTKKGTSFVDCANLAALDYYKLDGILSFDEFYKDKRIKG